MLKQTRSKSKEHIINKKFNAFLMNIEIFFTCETGFYTRNIALVKIIKSCLTRDHQLQKALNILYIYSKRNLKACVNSSFSHGGRGIKCKQIPQFY
jgi:hypothetical protein